MDHSLCLFILAMFSGLFRLQTSALASMYSCSKICPKGDICVMMERNCAVIPCNKIPVCTRPTSGMEKPGFCGKPSVFADCTHECTMDNDCPGLQKCCSNGCGMSCSRPLLPPKDGSCPQFKRSILANCRSTCKTDYDCTGSLKCCVKGCSMTCVDVRPVTNKPGFCPTFIDHCSTLCTADTDCPHFEKCCESACGTSCQTPEGVITSTSSNSQCPRDTMVASDCWNPCSSDADCFESAMCCETSCGRVCLSSTKGSSFYPQAEEQRIVLSTIS